MASTRTLGESKNRHGRLTIALEPLAHSGGHLLADHLQAVASMAAGFSQSFEPGSASQRWAYIAGLWHDLGKYRRNRQPRLQLDGHYIVATHAPNTEK